MKNGLPRNKLIWVVAAVAALGLATTPQVAMAQDYDVVVVNGRVIDPETGHDAITCIGINDGVIAAITDKPITGRQSKILRSYVRERGLMTMQEALRKMTLMPAQTLEGFVPQMKKKGCLLVGMDADIVVFDPETISDVGTYQEPNQPAVGVQTLLVNGVPVIAEGKLITNAAPGRPIRRAITK